MCLNRRAMQGPRRSPRGYPNEVRAETVFLTEEAGIWYNTDFARREKMKKMVMVAN